MRLGPTWSTRSPSDRLLAIALGVSIALHVVVLSLKFKFPDAFDLRNAPKLDVVLVNAKSATRPEQAEVLAQANLDGGGNSNDERRAKTPLPALPRTQTGNDQVEQARARVAKLEQQQREMLAQLKPEPEAAAKPETAQLTRPDPQPQTVAPAPPPPPAPAVPREDPQPAPNVSGQDLASRALAMARLEAQIARQVEAYSKRPRKNSANLRAAEVPFAMYAEDWRQKVERIGNANYPGDARGRIYGSLRLTVGIKADGQVAYIEVDRPSGYPVLDRAAERIVRQAAPYAVLPAAIRVDTDILEITRTWIFAPGDKLRSE